MSNIDVQKASLNADFINSQSTINRSDLNKSLSLLPGRNYVRFSRACLLPPFKTGITRPTTCSEERAVEVPLAATTMYTLISYALPFSFAGCLKIKKLLLCFLFSCVSSLNQTLAASVCCRLRTHCFNTLARGTENEHRRHFQIKRTCVIQRGCAIRSCVIPYVNRRVAKDSTSSKEDLD